MVVGGAFTRQGIGASMAQFLAYGAGMGAVLVALTVSLALFEGVLVTYLSRLVPYVERISAAPKACCWAPASISSITRAAHVPDGALSGTQHVVSAVRRQCNVS